MVYYPKPMHMQRAFEDIARKTKNLSTTEELCNKVLSLPMHPYLSKKTIAEICEAIERGIKKTEGHRGLT